MEGAPVKQPSSGSKSRLNGDVPESTLSEKREGSGWRFPWPQDLPKGNPPLMFSELGLQAKSVIFKGFQSGHSLSVTALAPMQIQLSATKLEDLILGLVSTTLIPAPGALLEISGASTGVYQGAFSYNANGPGLECKATGAFPLAKSGQASLAYRHAHFTVQGQTGLHAQPPVDISMTLGGLAGDLTLGAEASYASESQTFSKLNAGLGMSQGNVTASALYDIQNKKAVDFVVSQTIDPKLSVAAQYSRSVTGGGDVVTYGVQYQPDPKLTLKGRFDNTGQVAALLQHEVSSNALVGIQAEWATDKQGNTTQPRIGINVNIIQ